MTMFEFVESLFMRPMCVYVLNSTFVYSIQTVDIGLMGSLLRWSLRPVPACYWV